MEKRGASHIEVILAVILFIGFVGAALYFFSPANSNRIVDSSLSYVFSEVKKNTRVDLDTYSVKLSQGNYAQIISLTINNINDMGNKKGERVENKDYQKLESGKDGNTIHIKKEDNDFFYVMISEDFEGGNLNSGSPLPSEAYKKGISSSRKVISEKRARNLKSLYDDPEKYQKLKEEFNIPRRVDFSFELEFYNEESIEPEEEKAAGEVFSKDENVEVLRENGKTEFAILRVKVW